MKKIKINVKFLLLLKAFAVFLVLFSGFWSSAKLEFKDHQFIAHGKPMPQLYGAELQYFRLRGGAGKNIDADTVYRTWDRAMDHMLAAQMNTINFYIPWDFHEYKEGSFDFTGTVDEDHDGKPDYPSRNLIKFLEMAIQKGFKSIMIRPGPYINAEWGFLGFGAIPLWFHEKYPDSHMQNYDGQNVKLIDYLDTRLLHHTKLFFRALNTQVLRPHCFDKGYDYCPIHFIQVDNESNYMWQTIYNLDYGPRATLAYQQFLKHKYEHLEKLNKIHQTNWVDWSEIKGPKQRGLVLTQDQDWYDFHDETLFHYLKKIRNIWEDLGYREPNDVIFTLAEAYTAMKDGLLPNMKFRNWPQRTGMATVNLYVKTFNSPEGSPHNHMHDTPFRTDHDVKFAETSTDFYTGDSNNQWVMGPEIQGGWWENTPVSIPSRKQTYLSAIGHGLKSHSVYYFSEGFNWQWNWLYHQTKAFFDREIVNSEYKGRSYSDIPCDFWDKLKITIDNELFNSHELPQKILLEGPDKGSDLYFDAPLDKFAQTQKNYDILYEIGNKVIRPYGDFLGKAVEWEDDIVILKDPDQQKPSDIPGLDNVKMNADWSSGLVGGLLLMGYNPKILSWGINKQEIISKAKIIIHQDANFPSPTKEKFLKDFVSKGGLLINFFGTKALSAMKFGIGDPDQNSPEGENTFGKKTTLDSKNVYSYSLNAEGGTSCKYLYPKVFSNYVVECVYGDGKGIVIQSGLPLHAFFNHYTYEFDNSLNERLSLFKKMLTSVEKSVDKSIQTHAVRTVAFARVLPNTKHSPVFITLKTANITDVQGTLEFGKTLMDKMPNKKYLSIKDLFSGEEQILEKKELREKGYSFKLKGQDTTQLFIE